ncbi:MAG: PIN domain-containing protein [Lyngbya sp. HA4199-MV5]|jgi:predicted nucleic acid-binding protein|nr:PIN domain-containing protein [Lyngbya sp. HA4199-MV5]
MDVETITAVADTGFVVALLNRTDQSHAAAVSVYLQQQSILLPQTTLTEVAYLVGRDAGTAITVAFLQGLSASRFRLTALTEQDLVRVAAILAQYTDSRIDFVDATVMAIAERYRSQTILTLDQ